MSLDSLPVELVIAVAELLGPFSSFDFALTSKVHWKLCESIITKHKHLFTENRTIDATDSAYPYTNHILWDKLKEISANEIVGEYVRDISLPSRRATYLDGDAAHAFQLSDQSARPPPEDLDRYTKIRQRIERLYGWEATAPEYTFFGTDWDEWILRGSSEPIIVMLTHYTPYLRVFRFTDLEMDEVFSNAIRIIAASYSSPSLAPKLPFQHLTTVAVAHWDSEMSCHSDWCIFFCAIPSVRNFVANAMSGDESDDSSEYLPVSNVTELVFCNSLFATSTIEDIVRRTPKLERFSYERGDATVSDSVTPTPLRDLKALVDHVGHSLQHLVFESRDIMDDESEDLAQVSLRGFQKLKTLRIDVGLLRTRDSATNFDDEEKSDGGFYQEDQDTNTGTGFNFLGLLPASLEKLHLTGFLTDEEKEAIGKIPEVESEFTPVLKKILIGNIWETNQTGQYNTKLEYSDVPDIYANPLTRYLEGHGYD